MIIKKILRKKTENFLILTSGNNINDLKIIINLNIQDYSIQTTIALENLDKFSDWWTETNIHTDQLLKISVIDFLCRFQQEFCLKKSTGLFETIPLSYFLSPNNQTNKYIIILLSNYS
jgi:hypothetical protein